MSSLHSSTPKKPLDIIPPTLPNIFVALNPKSSPKLALPTIDNNSKGLKYKDTPVTNAQSFMAMQLMQIEQYYSTQALLEEMERGALVDSGGIRNRKRKAPSAPIPDSAASKLAKAFAIPQELIAQGYPQKSQPGHSKALHLLRGLELYTMQQYPRDEALFAELQRLGGFIYSPKYYTQREGLSLDTSAHPFTFKRLKYKRKRLEVFTIRRSEVIRTFIREMIGLMHYALDMNQDALQLWCMGEQPSLKHQNQHLKVQKKREYLTGEESQDNSVEVKFSPQWHAYWPVNLPQTWSYMLKALLVRCDNNNTKIKSETQRKRKAVFDNGQSKKKKRKTINRVEESNSKPQQQATHKAKNREPSNFIPDDDFMNMQTDFSQDSYTGLLSPFVEEEEVPPKSPKETSAPLQRRSAEKNAERTAPETVRSSSPFKVKLALKEKTPAQQVVNTLQVRRIEDKPVMPQQVDPVRKVSAAAVVPPPVQVSNILQVRSVLDEPKVQQSRPASLPTNASTSTLSAAAPMQVINTLQVRSVLDEPKVQQSRTASIPSNTTTGTTPAEPLPEEDPRADLRRAITDQMLHAANKYSQYKKLLPSQFPTF